MDMGLFVMELIPKSVRRTLRESLRIVLREELQEILKEEFNKRRVELVSNSRLVALKSSVSEQRLLPHSKSNKVRDGDLGAEGNRGIYATPKTVVDINECYFYHTMDIPGYGHVEGEWDLRQREQEYLGGVDVKGKRVLEVGTASGFLCFYMESQGAEVVAYDLSENQSWDIIPFSGYDYKQMISDFKTHIKRLNNGYWLCHQAYNSNAKMVYGTVYAIPEEIGLVDISVLSSILLHVRDPFLALQNVLRLTKETVIIAEPHPGNLAGPHTKFLPEPSTCEPKTTWWSLSPDVIKKFIGVLGFEETEVKYHTQKFDADQASVPYYTIVGHRTKNIR